MQCDVYEWECGSCYDNVTGLRPLVSQFITIWSVVW